MAQTCQFAWFKWAKRLPVREARSRAAVVDTRAIYYHHRWDDDSFTSGKGHCSSPSPLILAVAAFPVQSGRRSRGSGQHDIHIRSYTIRERRCRSKVKLKGANSRNF
jgi:hypothetical protein